MSPHLLITYVVSGRLILQDMATAYHKTIFVHVAQKLNIPDKLAKGEE